MALGTVEAILAYITDWLRKQKLLWNDMNIHLFITLLHHNVISSFWKTNQLSKAVLCWPCKLAIFSYNNLGNGLLLVFRCNVCLL